MVNIIIVIIATLISYPIFGQTTYVLSEESDVKISGNSSIADWTVTGKNLAGKLTFKQEASTGKEQQGLPSGNITGAEVRLNVTDIHSEKGETMDSKVYKALKSDEHPTIHFTLQNPIEVKNRNHLKDSVPATGRISIAGVTKNFSCNVAVSYEDNGWHFAGRKRMKMSDFQIEPPSAMFGQITTGDDIEINLSLIYRLEDAK